MGAVHSKNQLQFFLYCYASQQSVDTVYMVASKRFVKDLMIYLYMKHIIYLTGSSLDAHNEQTHFPPPFNT